MTHKHGALSALLLLPAAVAAAQGANAASGPFGTFGTSDLALGALALIAACGLGAVGAVAGWLVARQRYAGRLHAARSDLRLAAQLAATWVWQTDAGHRLMFWRPPPAAPHTAWAQGVGAGSLLWETLQAARPAAAERHATPPPDTLRSQLQAHGALQALTVLQRAGPGQPAQRWRLCGQPRFDADGQFQGYLGTAEPLDPEERRQFEEAALRLAWHHTGMAALGALRAADGDPEGNAAGAWQTTFASEEAARLMNLPPGPPTLEWTRALARLPGAMAAAAAQLQPGQSAQVDNWKVSLLDVPAAAAAGASGRLLLLRRHAPEADGTARTSADPAQGGGAHAAGTSVERAAERSAERLAEQAAERASGADHESFTYSVSHDLRAPIRVVDGFARILKEDYGRFLDRIGNDHVDRVLAAAARMNSMIDALLALSRLQSQPLARKPVDLSQLALYIVEDLQRESPERKAQVSIEPGIVVQGDPTLLRIALENLLGNAWKYSGKCALTQIEFRRETRNGQRTLMVGDNGAGFDMRFADRLFGVFQRLHSAKDFQGTGIGLASVRRIVHRHGGDIWAESDVGHGARFYFTLSS